jgi:hypothetical protein
MRTELLRLRIVSLTLVVFVSHIGFAQAPVNQQSFKDALSSSVPSTGNAGSSQSASANEQILKELDAMRERIQELESQLKAQSAGHVSEGNAAPEPRSVATTKSDFTTGPAPDSLSASSLTTPPLQEKAAIPATENAEPFSNGDFSWLSGNARTKDTPYATKFFTPEIRFDVNYTYDFNHPKDNTIGGSSEIFRHNEFQLSQLGIGGDFHLDNVRGRVMTQFGMYSQTQPRNDASTARGQWNLGNAYQYLAEAYGGYHFNKMHGINVDAGIFMSYIGLWSFYNFDNWTYQPSYVSSNTPWFFNGLRVQLFPSSKLKIEPWFINGWQSYGKFNNRPGVGGEILWRPNGSISIVANQYALGADTLGNPNRIRYHTDDSIQVKYYDNPSKLMDKAAFTFTIDAGCESGGGVSCFGNGSSGPKQSFLGFMEYNRFWFHHDLFGVTLGGGAIDNPGRYLVLLPPINGATAFSGTPYFTQNPGDPFKAWDASATFDYMPSQYITFRWEYVHRGSNVPYFSGTGGITPNGGNTGAPGSVVAGFTPDLRKFENRGTVAILVKF